MRVATDTLIPIIDAAWEDRASLSPATTGPVRDAVAAAIAALDAGQLRVSEREASGEWIVHEWLKKAVLLSFRLNPNRRVSNGPDDGAWWDKVPSKFAGWTDADFSAANFRAVPGAIVRRGAYVAPDAVLMPSFVNIGAHVGAGTMVDTWTTVGSCAQIGKRCHLSGGVGIGGVLEPLQAKPVIIEDDCFIGARSEVAEGVIIREGVVLGMGVYLGASTPIINRATGEILYGEVPAYSVVISGGREGKPLPNQKEGGRNETYSMYAAIIVKRVDAQTRSKTSVNDLLRI